MSSAAVDQQKTSAPILFPRGKISIEEIQRGICEAADLPLERAKTIPAQAYTSEEFYEWEVANLFRNDWLCVAHISQIPNAGDFLNVDLLDEPLVIIRGKDESVRVLSRVCPHRAMDIMPEGYGYEGHGSVAPNSDKPACGHTRFFLCPYHAWSFELDGQLKASPEMHEAAGFCRDEFSLRAFHSEVWQGFVFVNLDGNAPPLAPQLTEMEIDIAAYKMAGMQLVIAREWDCEFNWKVLVENFMESYHHLGIHHKTLQPMMPARDTWTEPEHRRYVRAHLPYKDSLREELRERERGGDWSSGFPTIASLNETQKTEWGLFLIHPNCLLATAPDRVIWYRLQPLGADRMKLLTTTLVAPEVATQADFEELRAREAQVLYAFHIEDMEVCTGVQRGLRSSSSREGRLSHLEMPIWLFHRYIAARIRGIWATEV